MEPIERYRIPPVSALLQIPGCTEEIAEKIRAVLAKEVEPEDASPKCAAWVAKCYNRPSWHERAMEACDEILGGCGVEALRTEDDPQYNDSGVRFCPAFSYVNFGDTYVTTLLRDHEDESWLVASWGDAVEEYEAEHKIGSFEEYEEEPEACRDCGGTALTFETNSDGAAWWACDSCNTHHQAVEGYEPEEEECPNWLAGVRCDCDYCKEKREEEPSRFLILPDGTREEGRLQEDADGRPIVDETTCNVCGFTWNDALITSVTPTPAGRCPNEYGHKGEDDNA